MKHGAYPRAIFAASLLIGALPMASAAPQQQSQSQPVQDQYQGVSRPPSEQMTTLESKPDAKPSPLNATHFIPAQAKPSPSVVMPAPAPDQAEQPAPGQTLPSTSVPASNDNAPIATNDAGMVAPNTTQPALNERQPDPASASSDPDGDMVRPRPARAGELTAGSTVQVKMLERISSAEASRGDTFEGEVAYDVLQDGKVLIPAGSRVNGVISSATTGHFAGRGSMHLKPETLTLPNGRKLAFHAEVTGTPGSNTRMGQEGAIGGGTRYKRDGVEYGAVVGTGAVAGAVLGGPVGALTGSLVGAGLVTTHLMMDHPQATLETGSIVLFTLTSPLQVR